MNQQKKRTLNFAGLDDLSVSDLSQNTSNSAASGKPLQIPVDKIKPDPNQPRKDGNPGFSKQNLIAFGQELTVEGVKTPLSIKSADENGDHILNHGERRWRAAVMAGLKTVPAFIDDKYDAYNQVKENTEREDLTILEMANFIKSRQDLGETNKYISERLGMSAASVSQYSSFHTYPPEIRALYDDGRCQDILALYELNNIYKQQPLEASKLIKSENVGRASVLRLKADLKAKKLAAEEAAKQPAAPVSVVDGDVSATSSKDAPPDSNIVVDDAAQSSAPAAEKFIDAETPGLRTPAVEPARDENQTSVESGGANQPMPSVTRAQPAVAASQRKVMVVYEGAMYVLRTDLTPTTLNTGWIAAPSDESEVKEVELSDVKVDSLV